MVVRIADSCAPAAAARVAAIAILLAAAGCTQTLPDRAERMTRGYIYYLDGAGGGGRLRNYSAGLRQGMLDAGYDGAGEVFEWQTGLGMVADQRSSVEYKRGKAAHCARRIEKYVQDHPAAPVTLMGLSAGTAVAVFALEALSPDCRIENVVLLSASLGADYDLTQALRRVRGRMYVTTSEKDAMLAYLVPLAGTADRRPGTVPSAGLSGFQMPADATPDTRDQYVKLMYIRWTPELAQLGDEGGHFDTVNARFIQVCIAPLIMRDAPRTAVSSGESPPAGNKVRNPDYDRWANFPAGSWATLKGHQSIGGVKQDTRMTAALISRQPDMIIVERKYFIEPDHAKRPARIHGVFIPALIDPAEHPISDPDARITELPPERFDVAGKPLTCRVQIVQSDHEYPDYGREVSAQVCWNETVPGGIVRVRLRSSKSGEPFEFQGELEAYGTR